jgi:hypothetical protein
LRWVYDNPTYKDRDDCSVRAFAKLLDKPYVDVKNELMQLKRLNRIPRYYDWGNIAKYIKRHKLKSLRLDRELTIKDFLEQFPVGKFLFYINMGNSGHLATGIDGVLYDSWDSSGEFTIDIWQKE